jgi:hypothetical protein
VSDFSPKTPEIINYFFSRGFIKLTPFLLAAATPFGGDGEDDPSSPVFSAKISVSLLEIVF